MRAWMKWTAAVLAALLFLVPSARAVTLPSGLRVIGDEAFLGTPFTDITVPEGVSAIGARAFAYSSLTHIVLPVSVQEIGDDAFRGLSSSFYAQVTAGSYAHSWCQRHSVLCVTGPYTPPSISALSVSLQGDKYIGTPYSTMDCQAFVEQCLLDAGLDWNLAGSNSWYRAMDWTGTPEECIALFGSIPKGAFLYILKFDGGEPPRYQSDGLGNASHIGIYTGRGLGAIHSSQSKGGVLESAFAGRTINGGWNRVGLWKKLDYGTAVNLWLASH